MGALRMACAPVTASFTSLSPMAGSISSTTRSTGRASAVIRDWASRCEVASMFSRSPF